MKERHGTPTSFFIVSVLGALYLLVEAGLQLFGRSVCVSEGCGLVAQITRFGDLSMVLIGFIALAFLALLSGLNLRRKSGLIDTAINLVLIAALAAEGFFIGYQIFWLPEVCLLCLSVFGIFFILGILRLLSGYQGAAVGFVAFAGVLCFVGLVLPPRGPALPSDKKMVLFYAEGCKRCLEIKEEIVKNKLDIHSVLVKEYTATLRSLGINGVPTLLVNGRSEKLILMGKEAIHRYLAACQSSGKSTPSVLGAPSYKKESTSKTRGSGSLSPLSPLGTPNPIFNPSTDEGVCKEDQKCD
jgi:glutaredoxin-related protein